jgi:hypothetical protein
MLHRFAPPTAWLLAIPLEFSLCASGAVQVLGTRAQIDFNRDIRPIFSEHCYACHGPDEQRRKAGLRLDLAEYAFKQLKSGNRALIPGDPIRSALVKRVTSSDPDEIMPPPKHNKPLKTEQIALLKRWVQDGAQWKKHWSFIPPERPAMPPVKDRKWPRNPIDYFILDRLEQAKLQPNPEADKATLIRRATLDLTGLPPTIEEVDLFLADKSPNAYERLLDRLLESPHYGERMAQNWLDLARYADTSGYHFDGVRFMWLWRDWVINSFNSNKPYDEFTIEQLAGDLLPKPSQAQRLATGFVRNNMTNDEGGADPEEYLNRYVVDRVNTVGAVWLGLTVGCTECHDHKYDPLTTKEFYQLCAFFHNVPEKGLDRIRTDNPPPRLPVPSTEQALQFVEADFALRDAEKTLQDRANELGETQEKWERETNANPPPAPSEEGLQFVIPFNDSISAIQSSSVFEGQIINAEKPEFVEGRLGKALKLDGKVYTQFNLPADIQLSGGSSCCAWVKLEGDGTVLSKVEKGPGYRGFDLQFLDEHFLVQLASALPDSVLRIRTKEKFARNQWQHFLATYDGSARAAGLKLYVNGRSRDVEVEKNRLSETIENHEPFCVGARNGEATIKGLVDDVRWYKKIISMEDARALALQGYLPVITRSRGNRTDDERSELERFYKENYAVDYLRSEATLAEARKRKENFYGQIPTSLIMEEMTPPRETFVLVRGDFRVRGERVQPGTPAVLSPLPSGRVDRLALARWLVAQDNPLMARVTVNRYWSLFFGTGLVKTMNDFGSQGEWPSHPELLDWLAVQFRDGDQPMGAANGTSRQRQRRTTPFVGPWDVKGLVRLILTSATYRQSAAVSPNKLEADPYNRLLSRGPRVRLDAEFIRDNALAIAGLLNTNVGGPSVKPYQPAGIWDGVDAKYEQDKGEALYRRGLYVFWRRSAHYPSFATFDAPSREVCTFLRQRTQTPLQSLVLMNDPSYVEAARGLAERVFREEPNDVNKRIVRAFRHTLGRVPKADEEAVLRNTYLSQLANFLKDPCAVEELLRVGESSLPEQTDPAEVAAMTAVASVLLNLNETITK